LKERGLAINHILKKDLSLKSREITESMSRKNVAKEYYRIYEEIVNGDYPLNYKRGSCSI